MIEQSSSLDQSADALGAQNLTDFAPILENTDRLEIRAESALGGFLRPRAVASKSSLFSAVCTGCHDFFPFVRFRHFSRLVFNVKTGLKSGPILPQNITAIKPST